jgi:hypothetical protein
MEIKSRQRDARIHIEDAWKSLHEFVEVGRQGPAKTQTRPFTAPYSGGNPPAFLP